MEIQKLEDLFTTTLKNITFVTYGATVFPVINYSNQISYYDIAYHTILYSPNYTKYLNCLYSINGIIYKLNNNKQSDEYKILSFDPI